MDRTQLSVRLLVTVLLVAPLSAARADEPWAAFRGPLGTGRALQNLPAGDGPLAFELRWKRQLGSGYSGISIAQDTLITAFSTGERDVVVALDPDSGEERWRYDLGATYRGHDGSHDGPISTPVAADGRVYVLGPQGRLAALALNDGKPEWSLDLVEDLEAETPFYGFAGSPLVVGEKLVLQIGGEAGALAAFDRESGELLWRSVEDGIFAQTPALTTLVGREQIVAVGSGKVSGVDPDDGTVLWSLEHGAGFAPFGAFTATPIPLDGDRVYLELADDASQVAVVRSGADGLEAVTSEPSRALGNSYSPAALWEGRLYGYTARFLSAFDPASGELLWRSRDPGDGFLVAVDGQLLVLTKSGTLHLGAASAEGWTESARLELFDELAWTPPSYADGSLYVRSLNEIARVDLVRTATVTADGNAPRPPEPLAELEKRVASAENPNAAVDEFLAAHVPPLVDGRQVTFLWRGEARDVAIAGDMIGMRREEPMRRLPGTDLWWWTTELDRRARVSYFFVVDYEPRLDPANPRRANSTVLGPDRNWSRGAALEMSWLPMPEWPGLDVDKPAKAASGGRLEELRLSLERPAEGEAEPETVEVPAWVWLPPGYDDPAASEERYPLVLVHTPTAREIGGWPATLDRVVGNTVRPLVVVFVEARRGVGGVFDAFVDEIDARYRTRSERSERANVGMGFPAISATRLTFLHGDDFGVLGVQSLYALDSQLAFVRGAIGETTAETLPLDVYFEWGRWDLDSPFENMDMRVSSREIWELLEERGWRPRGGEVWDSSDWPSWSHRTGVLLEALFPLDGEPSEYQRWTTAAP